MKNTFLAVAMLALLLSACNNDGANSTSNEDQVNTKTEQTQAERGCDAGSVKSVTACLCDLIDKRDNSDLTDDEYNTVQAKIDEVNRQIDLAIEEGKYSEADLGDEAAALGCNF